MVINDELGLGPRHASFVPVDIQNAARITAKNVDALHGYLSDDKPPFPEFPTFYIWRRVYQHKGKSFFKPYLLKRDGFLVGASNVTTISNSHYGYLYWDAPALGAYRESFSDKDETENLFPSPNGKWTFIQKNTDGFNLFFKNNESSEMLSVAVPIDWEDDWRLKDSDRFYFAGWNLESNRIYFLTNTKGETGRNYDFYQYDLDKNILTFIGGEIWYCFSNDGKWIVWVDNCWMDYADRQIHVFDTETSRDYFVTSGHSDNVFCKWENEVDHIKAGKTYYLNHQYPLAVFEYQKAIDENAQNDEAYGLIGYSHYKNKQIDESILNLRKSIGINSKNIMSHYNLAIVYWAKSKKKETVEEIRQVYLLNPDYKKNIYDDTQFKAIIATSEYKEMEKNVFAVKSN
jgi:tetratricopeptide (TPR) repeat protein